MNIYALSTGRGPAGIAIVRLTGKNTITICKKISKLDTIKNNQVNFCKLHDQKHNKIIDPESVLLLFQQPNSYTG